jgi:hypothetical protein
MRTRLADFVQATAELYVEAQVVQRRQGDARFTEAQRTAAKAELVRLCGNTAALLKRLDAQKKNAPGG